MTDSLSGLAIVLCAFGWPAVAAITPPPVVYMRDDPGGDLAKRVSEIAMLRQAGSRVEIEAGYCMSSCTLYLGLPGTCVAEQARLGFHGPSAVFYGVALPPSEFERWSHVMASHYSDPLAKWFMQTGRNRVVGFHELTGQALIELGVPKCG